MAQEHQEENTVDPATHSMRRKRGRPRKDDIPGSEPYSRIQRRKVDVVADENDPFVGQVVSGVLDGKFDAGYMLTVRVGERGGVLRGVVFEPGLSVPISAANDIAPNVKMFKRNEVSLPSAQQQPCFTPMRCRKDGTLRHQQRNESAMSSKGVCTDTVVDDLNAKVQTHSSMGIGKLPENYNNNASENLKQDLQCTIGDRASKDGIQNVQSTVASAEFSRAIRDPEVGKIVHLQGVVSEDKPISQLSQSISESKQAAVSDGRPGFTSDNKSTNPQEVVTDIKLNTQMSRSTSEAKQTVVTYVGPVSTDVNKTANLHEANSDAKPVTEVSQIKTSESKQSAEISDVGPVFTNGASDDYGKVLPPVTVQTSEHISGSVADAKPVMEVCQTKSSASERSAETSDVGPTLKNGASGDYGKVLPPVTVEPSGKLMDRMADLKPVTEVPHSKNPMSNQAIDISDSGPVSMTGASDDYGKTLSPVTANTSEQITERVVDAKPVTEVCQTKTSESKQSVETSDSGPVITKGASDGYVEVPPPVTVHTREHITDRVDDLRDAPRTAELSVDVAGAQHSVNLALEDGAVLAVGRVNRCVGQELEVHLEPLASESKKPTESSGELLMGNALAGKVIPEQLESDLAYPCGALNEVYSTATSETANSSFQGADVNGGS